MKCIVLLVISSGIILDASRNVFSNGRRVNFLPPPGPLPPPFLKYPPPNMAIQESTTVSQESTTFQSNLTQERIFIPVSRSSVRVAQQACEFYSNERMKKIYELDLDESQHFPWMAALGYRNESNHVRFNGAGVIISEYYILTAAHCVLATRKPNVVRLGVTILNDDNRYDDTLNHGIQNISQHENYSSTTKINDIALIRLVERIIFTATIAPACLQMDMRDESSDVELIVTVWGWISSNDQTDRISEGIKLQKKSVFTMPLSECNSKLSEYKTSNGINQGQYCTSGKNDSCQVNSGGPLQYFATENAKLSTVLGIVSYEFGCGSGMPDIYTRVSMYLNWIENIVWKTTQ